MDLQALADRAGRLAEAGDYRGSAAAYRTFLDAVQGPGSGVPESHRPQVVRSVAFNLAQVLNKLGDHAGALKSVELGLGCSPTAFGKAIAYAAKGEALHGLGRDAEGDAAFEQAAREHPVVGRLNSADSMTRVGGPGLLARAEQLVAAVESGPRLDRSLQAEAVTIRGKIAARRGDAAAARYAFERVLREFPDATAECAEARLQHGRLGAADPGPAQPAAPPGPVRWACTACGKALSVPAEYAGKHGRCPKCGTSQLVPES